MRAVVQFAGMSMLLALAAPFLSGSFDGSDGGSLAGSAAGDRRVPPRLEAASSRTETRPRRNVRSGRAVIPRDARGHYTVEARLNGRRVDVLIDTGASAVAINRSLAKRLGIRLRDRDFRHVANTANGRTRMALATLDKVRIGRVELRDVEAAVLDDASLDGVLLGMSFLGRLERFGVEGGDLVLVQ